MLWQEIIALSVVGITVIVFAWSKLGRKKKFSFERDTHCGCSSSGDQGKASIVIQGKRGEPPRVSIRNK